MRPYKRQNIARLCYSIKATEEMLGRGRMPSRTRCQPEGEFWASLLVAAWRKHKGAADVAPLFAGNQDRRAQPDRPARRRCGFGRRCAGNPGCDPAQLAGERKRLAERVYGAAAAAVRTAEARSAKRHAVARQRHPGAARCRATGKSAAQSTDSRLGQPGDPCLENGGGDTTPCRRRRARHPSRILLRWSGPGCSTLGRRK